jgi:hypothetical protein
MVWASRTCLNEILSNVLMFGSIVNWDQKGTFAPIWLIFNNFLETSQASFHWNSQRCNASVYPWPVMVSSFKSKSHSCIQPNVPGSFFLFPGCTSLTSATSSRRILLDFGFLLLDLRITDDETRTMKIGEIRQSDESGSPLLWAEIKQMFEEVTV